MVLVIWGIFDSVRSLLGGLGVIVDFLSPDWLLSRFFDSLGVLFEFIREWVVPA